MENLVKGFVSKGGLEKSMNSLKGDLRTLEEMMENKMENTVVTLEEMMEKKMENIVRHRKDNIVERIVKLLQNIEEKLPKGDDVDQGAQVEKPSINKNSLRGLDSNVGSNQGWYTKGIQIPKIDMRKFDGKDPLTSIFQMEQFFDIH